MLRYILIGIMPILCVTNRIMLNAIRSRFSCKLTMYIEILMINTVNINIILNPAIITVKLLNSSYWFENIMKYADYEMAHE